MSATSFGGSFDLVKSNDSKLKDMFTVRLKRTLLYSFFPFLLYLPFMPARGPEMDKMVEDIIAKRRGDKDHTKRDLLQILLDTNKSNPAVFSEKHIEDSMRLFMLVVMGICVESS